MRGAFLAGLVAVLVPCAGAQDAPPTEREARQALTAELAGHPFFSHTTSDPIEGHAPYLFLVQRGAHPDAARAAALAEGMVGVLDPLLERFEQEWIRPLGLEPRADRPRLVVAILASRAEFLRYQRATKFGCFEVEACFDPYLDAAVVYEDPARSAELRAQHARHALSHVLQESWYSGGRNAPTTHWILEAQADFLARPPAAAPLAARSAALVAEARTARTSWLGLRTLDELLAVQQPDRLEGFFRTHAPPGFDADERIEPDAREAVLGWSAFERQACLLFHFLHEGEQGLQRPALQAFVRSALAGRVDAPAFASAFAPRTTAELDRAFLTWIVGLRRSAEPGAALDTTALLRAFQRGDALSEEDLPELELPPALTLDDATPAERLAWALAELALGRMQAGRQRLDALLALPELAPELRARAETERRRAAAWTGVRDAFLAQRLAERGSLELPADGGGGGGGGGGKEVKEVKARLTAREGDELVLEDKRAGSRRLALEGLEPLALARQIPARAFEPEWARLYPYVLAGDARAAKLLKEDGGEASALLADARADYPERLALGRRMLVLDRLARAPMPVTPAEADAQLSDLRGLVAQLAGTPLLERERPELRQLARDWLARRLELAGPESALQGKLVHLGDGRVRLSYDFDAPEELLDFTSALYPVLAAKGLGTATNQQPFAVAGRAATGRGQAALRSRVELATPLTVRYAISYGETDRRDIPPAFALGLCDDGAEHFLWAVNLTFLQLFEDDHADHAEGGTKGLYQGTTYAIEVHHDGQHVTLACEGIEQCSIEVSSRTAGAFFLRSASDMEVSVHRLELEGRLLPGGARAAEQAWLERQLAGL